MLPRSRLATRVCVAALALPATALAQRLATPPATIDRVEPVERAAPIKTPEPASFTLMGVGLLALGGAVYRRRRAIAD